MSGRWYKRCGADFIHGTMGLTLEEKGAYSLCLDLIYDRGGAIPDDARWLSGVCGVSIRKWNALRDSLISAGKLYLSDGLLSNARADLEIVSAELSSRKLRESGAKGGRKRAENEAASNKNKDLGQATLKPKEEIREELPLSKDNGAGAHENSDKEFWDSAKDYLSKHGVKRPGPMIGAWVRDHGKEATAGAVTMAQVERAVEPIPFIQKVLRRKVVEVAGPDWGLC